MNPIILAVLAFACPVRADWGVPRLRVTELEGTMRVRVSDSLTNSLRGPVSADELEFWPGTVVEVTSGRAVFESDVHARVIAPAGSMFRVSAAEGRGLRVTSLPGTLPVSVEVGDFALAVWQGGSLAVYDGGRVEVDNAGVYRVPGGLKGSGAELEEALAETGISLTPGDSLSVDVPGRPAAPLLARLPEPDLRDALAPKAERRPPRRNQVLEAGVAALALAAAVIVGRNLL
ncbi:hypothetical protein EPO15_11965 [bacterium]|nr:MAG: hypothetical protein EPO15_11965 [bacterium]